MRLYYENTYTKIKTKETLRQKKKISEYEKIKLTEKKVSSWAKEKSMEIERRWSILE